MKVSVLMSVYNGEKYLAESINSVLSQTYKDFEFVIVNDGSNDDSLNIIKKLDDSRIKIIDLQHVGLIKALNIGLDNCRGEYIIRFDADDISKTERFMKLIEYMESNKNVSICGSWAEKINENGKIIGELIYPPIENQEIKKYILIHNPFIHPSVIVRKSLINKVGGYKNFKYNEDYELWTRILKKNEGHNIPEKLIQYRIHSNQITQKVNFQMRFFGVFIRILAFFRLKLYPLFR